MAQLRRHQNLKIISFPVLYGAARIAYVFITRGYGAMRHTPCDRRYCLRQYAPINRYFVSAANYPE